VWLGTATSKECFNVTEQKVIAFAHSLQKCANLVRLLIERCMKDLLDPL
jgi:hypothetical protein